METPAPAESIVIVDDEKSFTDMIGQLLGDHFTTPVHTFVHPADALKTIATLRPGVVVTDYYMPGMNGLDFIRAVQGLLPLTPCILITAHPIGLNDDVTADLENLKAILPKPFRWPQLAELIERHWHGEQPPRHRGQS